MDIQQELHYLQHIKQNQVVVSGKYRQSLVRDAMRNQLQLLIAMGQAEEITL